MQLRLTGLQVICASLLVIHGDLDALLDSLLQSTNQLEFRKPKQIP